MAYTKYQFEYYVMHICILTLVHTLCIESYTCLKTIQLLRPLLYYCYLR